MAVRSSLSDRNNPKLYPRIRAGGFFARKPPGIPKDGRASPVLGGNVQYRRLTPIEKDSQSLSPPMTAAWRTSHERYQEAGPDHESRPGDPGQRPSENGRWHAPRTQSVLTDARLRAIGAATTPRTILSLARFPSPARRRPILQHFAAQIHTHAADEHGRARDHLLHMMVGGTTEAAGDALHSSTTFPGRPQVRRISASFTP